MPYRAKKIYLQAEEYKVGWIHGFYDSMPDDGAFYGIAGAGYSPCIGNQPEAVQLYKEG